jgi:hypothetical protein
MADVTPGESEVVKEIQRLRAERTPESSAAADTLATALTLVWSARGPATGRERDDSPEGAAQPGTAITPTVPESLTAKARNAARFAVFMRVPRTRECGTLRVDTRALKSLARKVRR